MALEIIHSGIPRGRIRHALFDFDGTLSLIREGWQQIMIPMMVELLRQTPNPESEGELQRIVADFVARLTGRETIHQMARLAAEIAKRGGEPLKPAAYKRMYLDRLWERIQGRVAALQRGQADPDALMVPGARHFLDALRGRGVRCYLASGTDQANVREEAECLRLSSYFVTINGALDDGPSCSKRMVIERILRENRLDGPEFVAFGDGYVEIEEAKRVNGVAVGVASDEVRRTGRDEWKRARLISAGADLIVPDFAEHDELAAYLFEGK